MQISRAETEAEVTRQQLNASAVDVALERNVTTPSTGFRPASNASNSAARRRARVRVKSSVRKLIPCRDPRNGFDED